MLANILWFLAIGGLFFWMMRNGGGCCGGHDHGEHGHNGDAHDRHEESSSTETPRQLATPKKTYKTKDPVCGMDTGENGPESVFD